MAEPFFLKKRSKPAAVAKALAARPAARPAPRARPKPAASKPQANPANASASASASKAEDANVVEIQILSADPDSGHRFNLMRMNSTREVDPTQIPRPIMMNRKQPGPKQLSQFATDENGKIVGRYVFDEEGKPVLDEDGKPQIEKRNEMDMALVGAAPGMNNKRRGKRSTKEVFHQDVEVIKLRREEANPWVLEAKNPSDTPTMPEHWVGRMVDTATLPTVLLINEGEGASFTMVPLGRTYRFDPERPFKVMDPDQAHKYFEMQAKYKIHDRWGQRQENAGAGPSTVKVEPPSYALESRAQRMEWNIMANKGELPRQTGKRERFEDDYVKEQRNIGRGLEGGVDEELDYDINDDFQDDEDVNTFYAEDQDEKKLVEERQKKEFRWANTNVGDRPQIEAEEDDDEDDLFGEKLTSEGKRLRKMMRKRAENDDLYESTDEESDSDSEAEKEKKEKEKERDAPGSAERLSRHGSRSGSRGPGDRTGSPTRRPSGTPAPGSGAALLAKRAASRGGSPHRSRAGSPLARGTSPDAGRSGSPGVNGRAGSPTMGRGSSPAAREGTPESGASQPKKSAKRKASSESPMADSPATNKRKSPDDTPEPASRGGSPAVDSAQKKKKKKNSRASGSATPVPFQDDPFPAKITRDEVFQWLQGQNSADVPMTAAIAVFKPRIQEAGNRKADNQKVFLHHIKTFTEGVPGSQGLLRIRPEFMKK